MSAGETRKKVRYCSYGEQHTPRCALTPGGHFVRCTLTWRDRPRRSERCSARNSLCEHRSRHAKPNTARSAACPVPGRTSGRTWSTLVLLRGVDGGCMVSICLRAVRGSGGRTQAPDVGSVDFFRVFRDFSLPLFGSVAFVAIAGVGRNRRIKRRCYGFPCCPVMLPPLPLKVCKVRINKDLSLDFVLAVWRREPPAACRTQSRLHNHSLSCLSRVA